MRLRRQVEKKLRRSKRQSAFYLQACPAAHIAGREDTHPDELPPGPRAPAPSRPCEPMGANTITRSFLALCTLSPAEAEQSRVAQDSSQVIPDSHENRESFNIHDSFMDLSPFLILAPCNHSRNF